MGTLVTLTMRDVQRQWVLESLASGRITVTEAAGLLGRSVRQVRRLRQRYREAGIASLPHGNRGQAPANRLAPAVVERVTALAKGPLKGYNNHHLCEQLAEGEGLVLSVSTVRRIRKAAGLESPRKRRPPKHRSRRPRMLQAGRLLQIDGSPHEWLGPGPPRLTLLAGIDDATNEVFALFREEEDTVGYLQLLRQIVQARGVPAAVYSDRHTIFQLPPNYQPSLEEQLLGESPLTHFGRALHDLGIARIPAHSPQAKGRVERLFQTLQDRLANELQSAGVTTIEQANAFLPGFLKRFNRRFMRPAADPNPVYRPAPPPPERRRLLALRYPRTVARDHTVSFGQRTLDLPLPTDHNYAQRIIEIHVELDGQITFWEGTTRLGRGPKLSGTLRTRPSQLMALLPPPNPPPSSPPTPRRAASRTGTPVQPAANHPWRRYRQPRPNVLQSASPARRIGQRRSAT